MANAKARKRSTAKGSGRDMVIVWLIIVSCVMGVGDKKRIDKSDLTIGEALGLENITLGEAMCLVGFVVLPMVWVAIVNPASLGSTFVTFASLAYLYRRLHIHEKGPKLDPLMVEIIVKQLEIRS